MRTKTKTLSGSESEVEDEYQNVENSTMERCYRVNFILVLIKSVSKTTQNRLHKTQSIVCHYKESTFLSRTFNQESQYRLEVEYFIKPFELVY